MHAKRNLWTCQRGATLVMSLFASTLLVSFLFYLLGVGQAIRHGDHLRDAADSAAYTQAAIGARGMNLMALMNMVKLSIVALSTALVATALAASETIAWILSSHFRRIVFGWTIPFLATVQLQATTRYLDKQKTFTEITEAADTAQQAMRKHLSTFAEWRANEVARAYGGISGAFASPVDALPTEPEPQVNFCARVSPYAHLITHKAFESVPKEIVRSHARVVADALQPPVCMVSNVTTQRLIPKAHLGDEHFNTRLYSFGAPLRENEESGVRISLWQQLIPTGVGILRQKLSQVGTAQAEFYFDGTAPEAETLWHMRWKARMRRFRGEAGMRDFSKRCSLRGAALDCPIISQSLQQGRNLIIH